MIRKRVIILLVLLAGFTGSMFFIAQQRRVIATAKSRIAQLDDRKARLIRELGQAKRTIVPPAVAAPRAASTASNDTKSASPVRAPRPPSLMDIGRDNPHFMNAWVSDQRARLQPTPYTDLFSIANTALG